MCEAVRAYPRVQSSVTRALVSASANLHRALEPPDAKPRAVNCGNVLFYGVVARV